MACSKGGRGQFKGGVMQSQHGIDVALFILLVAASQTDADLASHLGGQVENDLIPFGQFAGGEYPSQRVGDMGVYPSIDDQQVYIIEPPHNAGQPSQPVFGCGAAAGIPCQSCSV